MSAGGSEPGVERRVVRRSQSRLRGCDGLSLLRRSWLSAAPQRAVLLVHGFAEHSGRYDDLGSWLAARDFAVHAYDHRGHGRSEGTRCHVDRFDEFLDDLQLVLDQVRSEHAQLPLSLIGHSMGGLIVAAFLCERKPDLIAAVTSGAALSVAGIPQWRRTVARMLRRLSPRRTLASGIDPEGLCRDPRIVQAYLDDPLVHRRMTLSLADELMGAVLRTAGSAEQVRVPLLMLHGEADPICPPRGTRAFHAQLRGPGHRMRLYPQLRHEILNEPEREQVYQDIASWLIAHEA